MKGKHDDLIMAIAMALYVGESSFSQLQQANDLTKAMLDSWTTSDNTSEGNATKQQNKPLFGLSGNQNTDSKQMYKDYGWLFGKVR